MLRRSRCVLIFLQTFSLNTPFSDDHPSTKGLKKNCYVLYCTLWTLDKLCVYIFFPFILDIKFVGRTSRGHIEFFIHLPSAVRALSFLARPIQPFLSLVDREIELCILTI